MNGVGKWREREREMIDMNGRQLRGYAKMGMGGG